MAKNRGKKLDITKEDFLSKMQELHGDKYELKSEFIDHLTEVEIFCHEKNLFGEEHGIFKARPIDIMKNVLGCPVCGGTKKSNTEEWVKKATYVHNGYFIYDEKTVYTSSNNMITVKCPHHGYIQVKANNHLNGANCSQCSREKIKHEIRKLPKVNASTTRVTEEEFFKRLHEHHGDKYDTSKTKFVNVRTPVTLICHEKDEYEEEHGEFQILPLKIFLGRGCRKCARNNPRTTEDFIRDSKRVHGDDAYIYDEVIYRGNHIKVILTCKKCGNKFEVEPGNHISFMQGCPRCASSKMERELALYFTNNNIEFVPQYKDGLDGLKADFYLPKYNVAIECQGEQHFKPIKFTQSISDEQMKLNFENQVKRDDKKYKLLTEQGIRTLYYTNLDIKEYRFPLTYSIGELMKEITKTERNNG